MPAKKILCVATFAIIPRFSTPIRVSYTECDITGKSAETETEIRKFWEERRMNGTTQTITTKEVEHWEEGIVECDSDSDDE